MTTIRVGDNIKKLREVLDMIEDLNARLSLLKQEKETINREIERHMEASGGDIIKNTEVGLSITRKEELVADYDPEQFEEIFKWCAESGRYDFIQRRVSSGKIREHVQSGGALPKGLTLTPITKILTRRT